MERDSLAKEASRGGIGVEHKRSWKKSIPGTEEQVQRPWSACVHGAFKKWHRVRVAGARRRDEREGTRPEK